MASYLDKTGLTHLWEKIKGLFAPLSSPTFTGVPIAPTAATTTNSTQIATTQYVQNNMAEIDISKLRDSATDNIFGTQDGSNSIAHSLNRLMYFRNNKVTNMNAVYKTGFYGTANTDSSMPYKGYWFVAVFCKDETRQIAVQWAMDTNKDYNGQLWMRTVRINAADTASGNMIGTWKKFADVDDIPTKMSQLTNDGEFATKAAADLTNYYLKSDTYTKAEVTALIGAISSVSISVVTTLPTTGESNIIYFVSKTGTAGDVYDEYVWISTAYEHIGSTSVDLNNYYTKTDADTALAKKVNIDGTTPMSYLDVGDRKAGSVVGKYSVVEGGDKAYTIGTSTYDWSNTASGISSHAAGFETIASGLCSHSEGFSTTASGKHTHAEGNRSIASGDNSHVEGYSSEASQSNSHAEGYMTKATNVSCHSEGSETVSSAAYAHAEGNSTTANGQMSHAEGYGSKTTGKYAHAEGYKTEARGESSHSGGNCTVAVSSNQTAIGTYNILDGSSTNLLIVGNGTSDTARSNAFVVGTDGSATVSTKLNCSGIADNTSKRLISVNHIQEMLYKRVRTIAVADWTNKSATISISLPESMLLEQAGMSTFITAAPASCSDYAKFGVYCSAESGSTLTFTCSKVPTVDLNVNILVEYCCPQD